VGRRGGGPRARGGGGGGGGGGGPPPPPRVPAAAPSALEAFAPHEARAVRWDALWERHELALRALRASQGVAGQA
jgi:hypothetical protein